VLYGSCHSTENIKVVGVIAPTGAGNCKIDKPCDSAHFANLVPDLCEIGQLSASFRLFAPAVLAEAVIENFRLAKVEQGPACFEPVEK